ncbi:MAG: thiamine pyrophosphate-dependent enzyme [bacterium]|nr:thiamine pyrophosphate-dependent enzyme [bacterium]
MPINPKQLNSGITSTWCPGCGDHFILSALNLALQKLNCNHEDILIVWGVGCAGNGADFMKVYGMHALHGRALPTASGAKLANPKLKVIVLGGDGDGYGIGLSHFIHTARRNLDLTYIVHNNQVYGLTLGQTSPTTEKGYCSKSTPSGVIEEPIKPIELALSSDTTFVARAYYKELKEMSELFYEAIQHRGFSLVDVLQICPTFKRNNTEEFYQEYVSPLPESWDRTDKLKAFEKAQDKNKLWYGVFYQENGKPTYCDELDQITDKTPAEMYRELEKPVGIREILEQFR